MQNGRVSCRGGVYIHCPLFSCALKCRTMGLFVCRLAVVAIAKKVNIHTSVAFGQNPANPFRHIAGTNLGCDPLYPHRCTIHTPRYKYSEIPRPVVALSSAHDLNGELETNSEPPRTEEKNIKFLLKDLHSQLRRGPLSSATRKPSPSEKKMMCQVFCCCLLLLLLLCYYCLSLHSVRLICGLTNITAHIVPRMNHLDLSIQLHNWNIIRTSALLMHRSLLLVFVTFRHTRIPYAYLARDCRSVSLQRVFLNVTHRRRKKTVIRGTDYSTHANSKHACNKSAIFSRRTYYAVLRSAFQRSRETTTRTPNTTKFRHPERLATMRWIRCAIQWQTPSCCTVLFPGDAVLR